MACAVTAWSPLIMRTSMPAMSAVATAALACGRSGSMMPTMPTKPRSSARDIGSSVMAGTSASVSTRAAKASTRRPFAPISSLAASVAPLAPDIGTWDPPSGPRAWLQRASTTSGAPLTSSIRCSAPSTVTRWNVAMNL